MVVKVNNLVKRYKETLAVDHLSFEVKEGEIFGLLGPNGSGKSTTINCILALLSYDKGEIELFGKPMTPNAYELKRNIGVIMQDVAVFEQLTVYENIDYFCGLYINDKTKRKELVEEAIVFTGLEDYVKFYPNKLSGGLLRRLNIACGIAHKPKLIILDEPTVAVDPQSRNHILSGIQQLNKQGATIIYTSHYMEEVEELCSRIMIMDKGKVLATGTKEELKDMIKLGERIEAEVFNLSKESLNKLKELDYVSQVQYKGKQLSVQFSKGKDHLLRLLDFFQKNGIQFGNIYSELPTLNDVFLEITGKELRD